MNTHPLFTLLHLLLNTPGLHTTHHSQGNADDLLIQKHKPPHHRTSPETAARSKAGRARRGAAGIAQKLEPGVPAHVCVCVSPSMTAVIIFVETTETVGTGSLPSDNSNLQKYFVWPPLPSIVSMLTFPSIPSPVHRTLEDGTNVGVWRLFAGTRLPLHLFICFFEAEALLPDGVWCVYIADVYLCAVLICSLGLLSIFLFTLILTCQYLHRRHRLKGRSVAFFHLLN